MFKSFRFSSFLLCLSCCYSSLFFRFPLFLLPLCLSFPCPLCVSCLCVLCCQVRVVTSAFHTVSCFTVKVPVLYAECLVLLPLVSLALICPSCVPTISPSSHLSFCVLKSSVLLCSWSGRFLSFVPFLHVPGIFVSMPSFIFRVFHVYF